MYAKRTILAICLVLGLIPRAFAADTKESALSTVTPAAANLVTGLQGGVNVNFSFTGISNLFWSLASGDCTIASGGAITCTKTSGVAFAASATTDTTNAANIASGVLPLARIGASAASHAVPVDVAGTSTWKVVPDCQDSTGNHINYTQSTDVFSCGTTSSAGSVSVTAGTPNTVVTPSPGVTTFTIGSTTPINAQTGTSYTVVTGDNTKLITLLNASPVAVTLPQAGSAGFLTGWSNCYANVGAGTVTITTTTSLINGSGSTLILPTGWSSCLASNGTDWMGIVGTLKIPNNTTTVARGDGTFAQVTLTTQVTGTLPVANGGTGVTAAQGNGTKVQLSTGTTTTNDCVKYDANGNTTDSGAGCGGSGTVSNLAMGAGIASTNVGGQGAITTTGTVFADASYFPFFLGGLTLSNDGGTPNTVIDVAAGAAASDDNTTMMKLAAFTKTTGAWAVGTGNGCLDTGSIGAATWNHVFVIERTDTSVVDVLCSLSATAPTMPTNYTKKRRIGSFKTASSNIVAFIQRGNVFWWKVAVLDVNDATVTTADKLEVLGSVPTGVVVQPICRYSVGGSGNALLITSPDVTGVAPTATTPFSAAPGFDQLDNSLTVGDQNTTCPFVTTDTSAQIRVRATAASTTFAEVTQGWID